MVCEFVVEMVEKRWRRWVGICLFLFFVLFDHPTTGQQVFLSWNERLALVRLRSSLGLRAREWPIKFDPCASWIGIQCNNGSVTGINVSGLRRTRVAAQNPAFSVEALENLTQLSLFNASGFGLPGSLPEWFGLKLLNLRVLDLSSCSINGTIPSSLSNLVSVSVLDLSRNSLTGSIPPGIGTLPGLRSLNLSHNDFNGSLPDSLLLLPSLQFLDVSVNNFTGILPDVSIVVNRSVAGLANLSGNLFYGNLANAFGRFQFVDISNNYFQGPVSSDVFRNISIVRNCLRNSTSQRSLQECTSFYVENNLVFDNFGEPTASPTSRPSQSNRNIRIIIILVPVFTGVALIIIFIVVLLVCKQKKLRPNPRAVSVGPVPAGESPSYEVPLSFSNLGYSFAYQQILQATNKFSDEIRIKNGHSGEFFRGVVEDTSVVIKKAKLSYASIEDSYLSELNIFSKLSHPRFVPLLGVCLENENGKFLVYKHLPKGDLASSLFNRKNEDSSRPLDWIIRLKIAIGTAEGLCYLHHECNPPLVHRDIQASSILLDDNFDVRLGSLSKVCVQESETQATGITKLVSFHKISAQGFPSTLNATSSYDVYCFGKVLMELVTGISSSTDATKKEWLEPLLPYINPDEKELVKSIMDPSLIVGEDLLEEVWAMAIIARSCLNSRPLRRPRMRDVLKALENPQGFLAEDGRIGNKLTRRRSWGGSRALGSRGENSLDAEGPE